MADRETRRRELTEEVDTWRGKLSAALLRVENRRRGAAKLPLHPRDSVVHLPAGRESNMHLLTLKVWTLRYCVSIDFIVEAVVDLFKRIRRDRALGEISLGVTARAATGVETRRYVEERVRERYPNGENRRILAQPVPPVVQLAPFDSPAGMLAAYGDAIASARRRMRESDGDRVGSRPYRRVLREDI